MNRAQQIRFSSGTYIDVEVVRWLKSRLMRGKGKVTPGDCPDSVSDCIKRALEAGTLKRLKKGVWCCCFEGTKDVGGSENTLIFMYRVVPGRAKPISTIMTYLLLEAPEKLGWEFKQNSLKMFTGPEPNPAILALLPNNIRRTITKRPGKRSKYTLHTLMVVVQKLR